VNRFERHEAGQKTWSKGNGALQFRVATRAGVVQSVTIGSPRGDVAPVFLGRTPPDAAALARILFSICSEAQAIAVEAAGEAALGTAPDAFHRQRRALRILCERFGEMLSASVLQWPSETPPAREHVDALRLALNVLRGLPDHDETRLSLASVEVAAKTLGLRDFPRGDGLFTQQWEEALADEPNFIVQAGKGEFLGAADDEAVAHAMTEPHFAWAPALPGRRVETGAAARRASVGFMPSLAGRMAARFADMTATLDAIHAVLAGGASPLDLSTARNLGPGEGFVALDSARGRLYHRVKLDWAGRIVDYAIIAPTEWNFHSDGPFVRLLRGAWIGKGPAARRRVERLAFVFDPCVGVEADVRDVVHA
jgi:hypothetical protein